MTERMRQGAIESLRVPANPLDVLAQQLVAMVSMDTWQYDDSAGPGAAGGAVRVAAGVGVHAVLDMLAGRYPSDAFAELRPRVVWDRVTGAVTGRPGAQRLAVTSGGTIPDRGLFGVFLAGADPKKGGGRVGELDEEMVYESRVGDVFTLGTSSWRIEDITRDRVLVSPAPGVPGRLPFWKGDQLGRPLELGRAVGAFLREVGSLSPDDARLRLVSAGLDAWAAGSVLAYLDEQRRACGHVPDDRTILVERFRDELGDWRVVVHSPFGAQVHAPWALALGARLAERYGMDAQVMHADDGIVLRLPDADLMGLDLLDQEPAGPAGPEFDSEQAPVGAADVLFDKGEVDGVVTEQVGGSALFASRFRECSARALLLPRRSPGRRTPLWQQRRRAAQLLQVASEFGSFPIVLEAVRECLQDVFDVPGLQELMGDIEARRVRLVEVTTPEPSPFARSLLFGYVAQFLYEGIRRSRSGGRQHCRWTRGCWPSCWARRSCGSCWTRRCWPSWSRELQWRTEDRRVKDAEGVADALRVLGPLTDGELAERGADPAWAAELAAARRAIRVRIGGADHWAAVEDAGRLRDALGTALPVGVPEAFTEPVKDPWATCWRGTRAPAAPSRPRRRRPGSASARRSRRVPCTGSPRAAVWCRASSTRRAWARSGATRRSCAGCGGAHWPRSARSWSRCRRGGAGHVPAAVAAHGRGAPAGRRRSRPGDRAASGRPSSRRPRWKGWCCRPACGTTRPPCSTSSPRPVRSCGPVPAHCPARTAGSPLPGGRRPLLLPAPHPLEPTALHESVLSALSGGFGLFFRQIADQVRATTHPDVTDPQLADALWDLA